MGFFDFLKQKKEVIIKFREVTNWMDEYVKEQNIDDKINAFRKEIDIKIGLSKELLEALDKAGLMNENIPERVKHIMDGNRKNYIHKITIFLDKLEVPEDYMEIREFSKNLTEKIDTLTKETQKSYFVLKEFVESDLAAVAKKVKEIENTAIKFRGGIEKANLHKLEEIKTKLEEYENSKTAIKELKASKEEKEKDLEVLKTKKKSIETKISELRTGNSYKSYESLKKEKEGIAAEIQKQKSKIITHFSTLEKAFKKYKRQSLNEQVIDKYLSDPINSLMEDEELKILEVLEKMLNSIDQLGLKDKKLEKTKAEIKSLDKELLTSLKEEMKEIKIKEKNNKEALLANTSSMNISEQESWLENTNSKIKEKEQEIVDSDNKIERINPNLIKQKVRDILKDFSVKMENG